MAGRRKLVAADTVSGFKFEGTATPQKKRKRKNVTLSTKVIEANKRTKERKEKAKRDFSLSMKETFLKMFVEKFGTDLLEERWPSGKLDITYCYNSDMESIVRGSAGSDVWDRVKNALLAPERPARVVPSYMMYYDPKKMPEEKKKEPINPMALTRAKAHDLYQDCVDLLYDTPEDSLGGVVVQYLRTESVSPMIANMMVNKFNEDFEPDENYPEIIEGEYSLANQSVRCIALGSQLQLYAEEAKNFKKPSSRKRRQVKGMKIGQMDKVLKSFKYMKIDDDNQVSSVDPSNIFGASAVLLFTPKYRRAFWLEAPQNGVLGIKGSTISGWDPEVSVMKTCNNPRKLLDWSTKPKARRSVKNLKGKSYPAAGRSNPNTIILAVFK